MALMKTDFDNLSPRAMTKIKLEKLNTAELKSYMKRAYDLSDEAFHSDSEQLQKSIRIIGGKLGTKFVKGEQLLKRDYGNRENMLKRAELLRSHLAIDVFTNPAKEDYAEIDQTVKDKINGILGTEFDDDEMKGYWFVLHEVKNLTSDFESMDVASMVESAFENDQSAVDVLLLIKDEYEKIQGSGMDVKQFIKRIQTRLRESF